MKLSTDIEFYDDNGKAVGRTTVTSEGNVVTIVMPKIPSNVIKLYAPDLREFLIRSKPNPEKFQP